MDQLWRLVVWTVPAAAVLFSPMEVNDLAYQVRAGAIMLDRWQVLRSDMFTFTVKGSAWVDQQWGSQIVLDLVRAATGWRGLVLVRATIVATGFGVTFVWTRRASGDAFLAAGLTLGALLVSITLPGALALRPQLLAVPLFLFAMWIVRGRADHPRRLLWTPVLSLVWANVHGSFVLLPFLLGIAFVGDLTAGASTRRWTGLATVGTLVVPLANPWGPGIYGYVVRLSTSPIVRNVIDEWLPLWRRVPAGPVFAVAVAGFAALLLWRHRRLPTVEEALGLAAFTVLAAASGRNLLWWSLYVPPVVGALVARARDRGSDRPVFGSVMSGLVVVLLAVGMLRVATGPAASLLAGAPSGLTRALGEVAGPDDRVFNGRWGSWFEYALPSVAMFDDSRVELFPTSVWDDYFLISEAGPGWERALDRWGIDVVVASPEHQAELIQRLESDPGWSEVFSDADGAVFARIPPSAGGT